MKKIMLCIVIFLLVIAAYFINKKLIFKNTSKPQSSLSKSYWFLLYRKSNKEFLYFGVAGNIQKSKLVRTFVVKTGIPGKKPTPLPSLLGRDYWVMTSKLDAKDNPETGPYFLTLNIPYSENEPYGPIPYLECNGQCNWALPGAFGLHGIGNDPKRLSVDDPGSSGCIRHSNEDITYLYNLLDLHKEVRYYIKNV